MFGGADVQYGPPSFADRTGQLGVDGIVGHRADGELVEAGNN